MLSSNYRYVCKTCRLQTNDVVCKFCKTPTESKVKLNLLSISSMFAARPSTSAQPPAPTNPPVTTWKP